MSFVEKTGSPGRKRKKDGLNPEPKTLPKDSTQTYNLPRHFSRIPSIFGGLPLVFDFIEQQIHHHASADRVPWTWACGRVLCLEEGPLSLFLFLSTYFIIRARGRKSWVRTRWWVRCISEIRRLSRKKNRHRRVVTAEYKDFI